MVKCIEYQNTQEMPCRVSVNAFVEAVYQILLINLAAAKYENFDAPTVEEIENALNLRPAYTFILKTYHLDEPTVLILLIKRINARFVKKHKR